MADTNSIVYCVLSRYYPELRPSLLHWWHNETFICFDDHNKCSTGTTEKIVGTLALWKQKAERKASERSQKATTPFRSQLKIRSMRSILLKLILCFWCEKCNEDIHLNSNDEINKPKTLVILGYLCKPLDAVVFNILLSGLTFSVKLLCKLLISCLHL